jgi:hypothetical protein
VNLPGVEIGDVQNIGSLVFDITAFSFASVAVVSMPTSMAMGLVGLLGVGVAVRRR